MTIASRKAAALRRFALSTMLALIAAQTALAASDGVTGKYTGSGVGMLRNDARTQSGDRFALRAYLQRRDVTSPALVPVQGDARFVLLAKLAQKPSVCYNDTIFLNDFDGDGF